MQVSDSIQANLPIDFWTIDMRDAMIALGEVSGDEVRSTNQPAELVLNYSDVRLLAAFVHHSCSLLSLHFTFQSV
jgi:hypothetical protein